MFILQLFQWLLKYSPKLKYVLLMSCGKLFIAAKKGISTYFEIGLWVLVG